MKTKTKFNPKVRVFYALLSEAGMKHEKENILEAQGVESANDLSAQQLDGLIDYLKGIVSKRNDVPQTTKRKRSTVITLLEMLGVYKAENPERWTRVNNYLKDPRIAGKLMYEMNEDELTKLARKLRAIHTAQVKKIQEENFIATLN